MPNNVAEGVILGGMQIGEKESALEDFNTNQVFNSYAFIKGVKLVNGNIPEPELEISNAVANQFLRKPVVTINVQNTRATLISNMSIKAEFRKENFSQIIQEYQKDDLEMAPNSNVDLPIYWNEETIEPGMYTLYVIAECGSKKWEKELAFTVNSITSENIKNTEGVKENSSVGYVIIGLLIIISLFLVYIIIIRKKRNFK
ncbi:hypothetical protein AZF37_07205 [endosymbiont 'TC1' of Trimyema compressum]|uniref:DUF3324 domain-containing protein n=1 Tax=endosymbiont 'TC1' of Trimyema compressum TaxID=243899 RepID=UPI0007F1407F|nr:DUF3324 domain-containing protein [endosymbiont 'TC1' of Trimyema compressum]AMP20976.1 hypothetical protein AZF37_07205 [endosymbiont 'TC1' of Trimyema compressum]